MLKEDRTQRYKMEHKKTYITNFWHTRNNYGANLTAFALQVVLQQMEYENELINNPLKRNETICKNCFGFNFQKQYLKTTAFIDKHIDLLNESCNTFITGSDQVFRPIYTQENPEQYWLDFVKPDKKKIAFSASFGAGKEQFLNENSASIIEHMKNSLKSFDFISVREKSGVEICKDVLGVDAEWIIDPVFILEKENYDNLIKNANNEYKNSIVAYVLDTSREYKKAYSYLSKKYNKKVIETANSNISVENWLASIRDCDLFVTDSFHGMCFALIFNKPFICLANKDRGATRFESICEMLGIENQCIDSILEVTKKDCVFKIDYAKVNQRIEEERCKGLDFLQKALDAPIQITKEKVESRNQYLINRIIELENQNNLNFQLKRWLWYKWLVIFYNLPEFIRNFIQILRGKR